MSSKYLVLFVSYLDLGQHYPKMIYDTYTINAF